MRDSISWYRVSIGLLCLYILEKGEIWSVSGVSGWYLVVLGQYRAVRFDLMLMDQYEAELLDLS